MSVAVKMLQHFNGACDIFTCRHIVRGAMSQESGVVYLVRLSNDQRVRVHVFVVHDTPEVTAPLNVIICAHDVPAQLVVSLTHAWLMVS